MSNQGYYDEAPAHGQGNLQSNNPWAHEQSQQQQEPQQPHQYQQQPQSQHEQSQSQQHQPMQHEPQGYAPPPGPPPGRADTFEETSFVPQAERGEQREAMEQFELSHGGHEDQTDRDVATLSQEFPGVDGSLIAALYGDSKSLSATREMLMELAGSQGS